MRQYEKLAYATLGIDVVVFLLGLLIVRPRGSDAFWFGLAVVFLAVLGGVFSARDSWEKRRIGRNM